VRVGQRRALAYIGLSETPNPTHPPHPRHNFFGEWNLQNYLLEFGLGLIHVVDFWDLLGFQPKLSL
jgi:hypothetical protein